MSPSLIGVQLCKRIRVSRPTNLVVLYNSDWRGLEGIRFLPKGVSCPDSTPKGKRRAHAGQTSALKVGIHVVLLPSYLVFLPYFWLVAKTCCKAVESRKPKAKNGFLNLKIGGYLAYTPWDTLLLALVGQV